MDQRESYGTVDDKRPAEWPKSDLAAHQVSAHTSTSTSGGVVGHRIGLTPTLASPTQPTSANPFQLTTTARISQPSICPGVILGVLDIL